MTASPIVSNTEPTNEGTNITNKKSGPVHPLITEMRSSGPSHAKMTEIISNMLKMVQIAMHQTKFSARRMSILLSDRQ